MCVCVPPFVVLVFPFKCNTLLLKVLIFFAAPCLSYAVFGRRGGLGVETFSYKPPPFFLMHQQFREALPGEDRLIRMNEFILLQIGLSSVVVRILDKQHLKQLTTYKIK